MLPRQLLTLDIQEELPSCIEDSELGLHNQGAISRGQSLMLAPVAHIKLSRIVGTILKDLYPIRPISVSSRARLTSQCSRRLQDWYAEIASFLDSNGVNTSLLLPIYQRQRNVLNGAYWHAMILTHRPLLLSNFTHRRSQDGRNDLPGPRAAQVEESIKECLQAALNISDLVDELVHTKLMFRAFWVCVTNFLCPHTSGIIVLMVASSGEKSLQHTTASVPSSCFTCTPFSKAHRRQKHIENTWLQLPDARHKCPCLPRRTPLPRGTAWCWKSSAGRRLDSLRAHSNSPIHPMLAKAFSRHKTTHGQLLVCTARMESQKSWEAIT